MTMHGIDVSGWQPANITQIVTDYQFALVKITGATNYTSKRAPEQVKHAFDAGKRVGLYHFALEGEPDRGAVEEAKHFVSVAKDLLKYNPVLVLDWEATAAETLPLSWAKDWLDYVYKQTGVKPFFYSYEDFLQKSVDQTKAIRDAGYPLWVASYGNEKRTTYQDVPSVPQQLGWGLAHLFQFTRTGRLTGYAGDLDLNVFYGVVGDWDRLAGKKEVVTPPKPVKKTVEQLAREVLGGLWGNGADRVNNLTRAGYNADAVQKAVNAILNPKKPIDVIAKEVIAQKWGNGADRVKRLKDAGYNPDAVQAEVNRQLGIKTIAEIAKEVIAGKWGNGNSRMAKLRKAGHNVGLVQAEVNRQLGIK